MAERRKRTQSLPGGKRVNDPIIGVPDEMPRKLDPRIKCALVTGAARRTGRAIALWLARKGVKVAIHYHTSREEARLARDECHRITPGAVLCKGDLTQAADAARVVEEATGELGGLHLLVNNVGNYMRKDLFELSPEQWRDQIESNLYSAFYCLHAAAPLMRKQKFGRVINLGYAGNERPTYNRLTVPYHIAKTGLAMLTRSAAAALAADGITVNTIGVGILENSEYKAAKPPAGRNAQVSDLCHAIGLLLDPESDHINGTQLDVNGGWIPEQIL